MGDSERQSRRTSDTRATDLPFGLRTSYTPRSVLLMGNTAGIRERIAHAKRSHLARVDHRAMIAGLVEQHFANLDAQRPALVERRAVDRRTVPNLIDVADRLIAECEERRSGIDRRKNTADLTPATGI